MKSKFILLVVATLCCFSSVHSFNFRANEMSKMDADLFLEDDEGSGEGSPIDDSEPLSPGLGQDDEDVVIPIPVVKTEKKLAPIIHNTTSESESESTTHVHVHVPKSTTLPTPAPPQVHQEIAKEIETEDEDQNGIAGTSAFSSYLVILPGIICSAIFGLACFVLIIYRCRVKRESLGDYEQVVKGKRNSI